MLQFECLSFLRAVHLINKWVVLEEFSVISVILKHILQYFSLSEFMYSNDTYLILWTMICLLLWCMSMVVARLSAYRHLPNPLNHDLQTIYFLGVCQWLLWDCRLTRSTPQQHQSPKNTEARAKTCLFSTECTVLTFMSKTGTIIEYIDIK